MPLAATKAYNFRSNLSIGTHKPHLLLLAWQCAVASSCGSVTLNSSSPNWNTAVLSRRPPLLCDSYIWHDEELGCINTADIILHRCVQGWTQQPSFHLTSNSNTNRSSCLTAACMYHWLCLAALLLAVWGPIPCRSVSLSTTTWPLAQSMQDDLMRPRHWLLDSPSTIIAADTSNGALRSLQEDDEEEKVTGVSTVQEFDVRI